MSPNCFECELNIFLQHFYKRQNYEADTYAMICRFFALDSDRRFPIRFRQVQFSSLAFSFSLCFTKNFASGFNSASLCLLFNANEEKKATRRRTSDKQSRSNLQCRVVVLCKSLSIYSTGQGRSLRWR